MSKPYQMVTNNCAHTIANLHVMVSICFDGYETTYRLLNILSSLTRFIVKLI